MPERSLQPAPTSMRLSFFFVFLSLFVFTTEVGIMNQLCCKNSEILSGWNKLGQHNVIIVFRRWYLVVFDLEL